MKKLTAFRSLFAALVLLGAGLPSLANAASMTVELTGYVNGKPTQFLNSGSVRVGDIFSFTFQFDDEEQTSYQYTTSEGLRYTLVDQPFSPILTGWSGALPDEFSRYMNGAFSGRGNITSWYRPLPTLIFSDWSFTGSGGVWFRLITQFENNLGYGWWGIGAGDPGNYAPPSPGAIDYGFISITRLNITPTSSVPVPATAWLLVSGLIGLAGVARRRAS